MDESLEEISEQLTKEQVAEAIKEELKRLLSESNLSEATSGFQFPGADKMIEVVLRKLFNKMTPDNAISIAKAFVLEAEKIDAILLKGGF